MTSAAPPTAADRRFEDDFAVRVTEARGRLSGNDERVIDQLRETPGDVAFLTSESLAEAAGVSRAAVVRFARKLGYAGFAELRDAARAELREQKESPLGRFSDAEPATVVERKARQDDQNLATTQSLAADVLPEVAAVLAKVDSLYVVGSRKSHGLALYAHHMLQGVRPRTLLVDPSFPDGLATAGPGDAVLALLFRRYSRLTISLAERAHEAGAQVIVLTDGGGHDFAAPAQHVLVAQAESPTLYESMVAAVWLLESLVAEVAAVDPERTRTTLATVERFTEDLGVLVD